VEALTEGLLRDPTRNPKQTQNSALGAVKPTPGLRGKLHGQQRRPLQSLMVRSLVGAGFKQDTPKPTQLHQGQASIVTEKIFEAADRQREFATKNPSQRRTGRLEKGRLS
jgi:hypothetical protein